MVKAGEDVFKTVRQREDMFDVQRVDAITGRACFVDGFTDGTLSAAPTNEEDITFRRAVNLGDWQFGGESLQLLAALGDHLHVQLR